VTITPGWEGQEKKGLQREREREEPESEEGE